MLILFFIPMFTCDGSKTQEDIENAISLSQTLRKDQSSPPKTNSHLPIKSSDENDTYTVKKHVLKAGETPLDIAILYKTDWQSIQRVNDIKDVNELKPGQTILIPIKKSDQQE